MRALPAGIPPWQPILHDGHSVGLAENAQTLFRMAIEPSCSAIAAELANAPRGPDERSWQKWGQLRDAQLELHRSYALALGGLWERHFRRHLFHSASALGPNTKTKLKDIEEGGWKTLSALFVETRGFPLTKFASHDDLELLFSVTSVVRHGNGNSSRTLFATNPRLFSNQPHSDWFSYFTLGGEPAHSIHNLEITFDDLVRFKDAIIDFWETISRLHASSSA
ncbi:hypothetical protein [Phenylobacterium ferrooxidans]|uniref:Uncharacterized protein n=1 Tax=Phenylobacterium ferrooxidans TaxID=2982689 RepID=A0ABW6CIJ1_9CAUL